MRSVVVKASLTLALLALSALVVACGPQDDDEGPRTDGPEDSTGDGLPLTLPNDFPLYPGLQIEDSLTLGDLYIVEASTQGEPEDVIAFYKEELTKGRWELLSTDSSLEENIIFFTAPGLSANGRVAVSQDRSEGGQTIVAIALPIDSLGDSEE